MTVIGFASRRARIGTADYDVVFGFLVESGETNEPHEFSVTVHDEDDRVVLGPIGGRVEVGRPAGMVAGQEQRVIIVLRGPFPVVASGNFKWVPTLDGVLAQPTRFRIDRLEFPQLPGASHPGQ